jgi:hypothetical protein
VTIVDGRRRGRTRVMDDDAQRHVDRQAVELCLAAGPDDGTAGQRLPPERVRERRRRHAAAFVGRQDERARGLVVGPDGGVLDDQPRSRLEHDPEFAGRAFEPQAATVRREAGRHDGERDAVTAGDGREREPPDRVGARFGAATPDARVGHRSAALVGDDAVQCEQRSEHDVDGVVGTGVRAVLRPGAVQVDEPVDVGRPFDRCADPQQMAAAANARRQRRGARDELGRERRLFDVPGVGSGVGVRHEDADAHPFRRHVEPGERLKVDRHARRGLGRHRVRRRRHRRCEFATDLGRIVERGPRVACEDDDGQVSDQRAEEEEHADQVQRGPGRGHAGDEG